MTAGASRPLPDDAVERAALAEGFGLVAGVDEVGRGAWAGPASVGVVVYRPDAPPPDGLRDSKEVPEDDREALYPLVTRWCVDWSVGHVEAGECDRLGMTAALRLAARRALLGLRVRPEVVLLDGPFDYISDPVAPGPVAPVAPVAAGEAPTGRSAAGRRAGSRVPVVAVAGARHRRYERWSTATPSASPSPPPPSSPRSPVTA